MMDDEVLTPLDYDSGPMFGPAGWSASTDFELVAAAFVAALGELKDVSRARTANAGTYQYRYADLGDALAEARPVLAAHGLAVFQVPTTDPTGATVATTVMHSSGQWLAFAPVRLPAGGTAQTIGSAITYARRYAVMAALGLATDDDDGAAASRGTPVAAPTLLPQSVVDLFRQRLGEHGLDADDGDAIVRAATGGRTGDIEEVWESETAALGAALTDFVSVPPGDAGEGSGLAAARAPDPSPDEPERGE